MQLANHHLEISTHLGFRLGQTKYLKDQVKWEVLWRNKNLLMKPHIMEVIKVHIMVALNHITSRWKALPTCHNTTQDNSSTSSHHSLYIILSCSLKCNTQWQSSSNICHRTLETQVHTLNIWKDHQRTATTHQFQNTRTDLIDFKILKTSIFKAIYHLRAGLQILIRRNSTINSNRRPMLTSIEWTLLVHKAICREDKVEALDMEHRGDH